MTPVKISDTLPGLAETSTSVPLRFIDRANDKLSIRRIHMFKKHRIGGIQQCEAEVKRHQGGAGKRSQFSLNTA
jgi:hypothetical protein